MTQLQTIRNSSFQEFLYSILYSGVLNSDTFILYNINQSFIKKLNNYVSIINNNQVVLSEQKNDEFTYAAIIYAFFSSLTRKRVVILREPSAATMIAFNKIFQAINQYCDLANIIQLDGDDLQVTTGDNVCEINFLNDLNFVANSLSGTIIFTACRSNFNYDKVKSIIVNKLAYDRIIIHFVESPSFLKLAIENNLEFKKFK